MARMFFLLTQTRCFHRATIIELNFLRIARMLTNRFDAYCLLRKLGAPARLIRHVELVGEAADLL